MKNTILVIITIWLSASIYYKYMHYLEKSGKICNQLKLMEEQGMDIQSDPNELMESCAFNGEQKYKDNYTDCLGTIKPTFQFIILGKDHGYFRGKNAGTHCLIAVTIDMDNTSSYDSCEFVIGDKKYIDNYIKDRTMKLSQKVTELDNIERAKRRAKEKAKGN